MHIFKKSSLFIIIAILAINFCANAQSKLKAIKAGKVIDVVNGTVLTNQVILI